MAGQKQTIPASQNYQIHIVKSKLLLWCLYQTVSCLLPIFGLSRTALLQQCITISQGLCHPLCDKDKTDSNLNHFSNVLKKQALQSSISAYTEKLLPKRKTGSFFTAQSLLKQPGRCLQLRNTEVFCWFFHYSLPTPPSINRLFFLQSLSRVSSEPRPGFCSCTNSTKSRDSCIPSLL